MTDVSVWTKAPGRFSLRRRAVHKVLTAIQEEGNQREKGVEERRADPLGKAGAY